MTDIENDKLRKEVERQAQIIDALLDSNKQLKQALAWCQHLLNNVKNPIYSNDISSNIVPQTKDEVPEKMDGVNNNICANNFLMNGVMKQNDDNLQKMIGVNKS